MTDTRMSPNLAARFRQTLDAVQRKALKLADIRTVLKRRKFWAIRNDFYDRLWRAAASELGATCRQTGGMTQISRGGLTTFVFHSDLMLDDAVTTRVMADKAITYDLMAARGIPVPDHCVFSLRRMHDAHALLARTPGGIAVKPARGSGGGRGVTTGVKTTGDLTRAARHAARFNGTLLAEPMLTGHCYRLLYLDGILLDAVRRDPPTVLGKGDATIRALIAAENTRRLTRRPIVALSPLIVDQDCRIHLAAQGLHPGSRPESGRQITVKQAINENAAHDNHSVKAQVHPDIIAAGGRLVRDLNVRFAGLDVIARDISAPPEIGGTRFHEINISPGIHHHYLISDPDNGVDVARLILAHMFDTRSGVMRL